MTTNIETDKFSKIILLKIYPRKTNKNTFQRRTCASQTAPTYQYVYSTFIFHMTVQYLINTGAVWGHRDRQDRSTDTENTRQHKASGAYPSDAGHNSANRLHTIDAKVSPMNPVNPANPVIPGNPVAPRVPPGPGTPVAP